MGSRCWAPCSPTWSASSAEEITDDRTPREDGARLPRPAGGGGVLRRGARHAGTEDDGRWENDPECPQHEHLDILVDDQDAAERAVLAPGATRLESPHEN